MLRASPHSWKRKRNSDNNKRGPKLTPQKQLTRHAKLTTRESERDL